MLKLLSYVLLFVLLSSCLFSHENVNKSTLGFQDIVQCVVNKNRSILAGEYSVDAKRAYIKQTRSALYPQLSAQAYQSRSRTMDDYGWGSLIPRRYNSFSSSMVVSMSIVNPANWSRFESAKMDVLAAEYGQRSNVQNEMSEALQFYYKLQRYESSLMVTKHSIELDETLFNMAKDKFEAQVATELDVTRAKSQLALDNRKLLQIRLQLEDAQRRLLQKMGMDFSDEIQFVFQKELRETQLDKLPGWIQVVETQPEFMAGQELLDRYEMDRRAENWAHFPTVSIQGQAGHVSRIVGDDEGGKEWAIGLTLNWNIWDGGNTSAREAQAVALIHQQEQLLYDIRQSIRNDYAQAISSVKNTWAQIPLARNAVDLGKEELKYAREYFEAGMKDNSDVIKAQTSLTDAEDALVDAVYQYNLARLDLARVLSRVEDLETL
jgi:outer membrane protein TolC